MPTVNAPKIQPDECLWDARDVAAFLKVSRSWVYQRSEAGLLPTLRVGGLVRFEPDAIRAWARGEQPTAAKVVALRPVTTKSEG